MQQRPVGSNARAARRGPHAGVVPGNCATLACRLARGAWIASLAAVALAAAMAAGAAAHAGAEGRSLRLLLPFPITGPRDIQGIERATRAYRAISPHAPQPLSDVLADVVVMAAAPEFQAIRVRRPSTDNDLDPARIDAAPDGRHSVILVSQESIVPPGSAGGLGASSSSGSQPQWIAPLAVMPLALVLSPKAAPLSVNTDGPVAGSFARLGCAGERSASHLAGALFAQAAGRRHVLRVPYNGGYAALNALLTAEIDMVFAALPLVLPYIESGKLPTLGLASPRRFVLLPQVPTLAEAGIDLVWEGWFALTAGRTMPAAVRASLRARVQATLASPAVRSALLLRGLEPADADIARFAQRVDAERVRIKAARVGLEQ